MASTASNDANKRRHRGSGVRPVTIPRCASCHKCFRPTVRRAPLSTLLVYALAALIGRCQNVDPTNRPREASNAKSLHDVVFPYDWLDGAWEAHPLLATVKVDTDDAAASVCTADRHTCASSDGDYASERRGGPSNAIPTVFLPPDDDRLRIVQSIFTLDDLDELLSQPIQVVPGEFKKASGDGGTRQESETVPSSSHGDGSSATTPQDLIRAMQRDGQSLVVNFMQRRWVRLAKFCRSLWGGIYMDAALYLTPAASDAGASAGGGDRRVGVETSEAQDEGEQQRLENKRRRALIPHRDFMDVFIFQLIGEKQWSVANKPTVELSFYDEHRPLSERETESYLNGGKYDDFVLRPGDILYIPRGFAHNASTVSPGDGDLSDVELTGGVLNPGASAHVTFGVGHGCLITVEALIHFALHGFFLDHPEKDKIVIKRKECPGSEHHIRWGTLMHLYLSAVARSKNGCSEGEGICGLFRRTVLRRPSLGETADGDIFTDSLNDIYNQAIEVFTRVSPKADPASTLRDFARRFQEYPEMRYGYCFPAMGPWDNVVCPEMLDAVSIRDHLVVLLSEFRAFSLGRYEDAEEMIVNEVWTTLKQKWERDDSDLAKLR